MVTLWTLLSDPKYPEKLILQKLYCALTWYSREELRLRSEDELPDDLAKKIVEAHDLYVHEKKPIEYLLGYVEFFWRRFVVTDATLIPRPETEYMISAVTEYINSLKLEAWSLKQKENLLLDIGTGCGVLGISVLLQNPWYFCEAILADYFANALEIAKQNYETYKEEILAVNSELKVEIFQSDLLMFIENWALRSPDKSGKIENSSIVLVANLPYIPEEMFEVNVADNVKKFEPKPAFVGGQDGLDYYRTMFDQILQLRGTRSKEQGPWSISHSSLVCFLEMMTWQVEILREAYGQYFEFEEVKTFHFNIRIVKVWFK